MSLAKAVEAAALQNAHNVAILDIERMKGRAEVEFWDLGDFKGRRIHADDVTLWPRSICLAWNWYDGDRVEFASEWGDGREAMLRKAWEVYDKAQIVVGHNIRGFDTKKLRSEWRDLGLPPPSPTKLVDTLAIARREFGDESKTLDALCKRAGLVSKTDRYDVDVARRALAGDRPSQRQIKAYNIGDIAASKAFYDLVRPWDPSHPHSVIGTIDDRKSCNSCWTADQEHFEENGYKLANQILYRLYRCTNCGANVQGTRHSRAAITRGAR